MRNDFDVVIIGAGPSGIASIRQVTQTSSLDVVCFESRDRFGGVWDHESKKSGTCEIGFDRRGHPFVEPIGVNSTPIYEGLRTNVPKRLMAYRHQGFLDGSPVQFPSGHQVADYLDESAVGLERYVQFNHEVHRVSYPSAADQSPSKARRWVVEVVELPSPAPHQILHPHSKNVYCDFVLAATGHYNVPYVPFIPSLWTWPKEIIHSYVYREASDPMFQNKTVAVVGIGPSGYDIVRELAMLREKEGLEGSKRIYSVASHPAKLGWDFNDPAAPTWTKFITTVPRFEKVEKDKIHLVDGRILEDVDLLCFATGYLYSFPFCRQSDLPWKDHPLIHPPPLPPSHPPHTARVEHSDHPPFVGGLRVHNLDQNQMFYYPDPSFGFLVLQSQIIPFPMAEYQARAIVARWSGRKTYDLMRMANEVDESKAVHALPAPAEFELENKLLEMIGEGGGEDTDHNWGSVPAWKYQAREQLPITRRNELGY